MRPEDFLELAGRLAAEESEAAWRTAASRAYYAAFHVARSLLGNMGFMVPRDEHAHVYVQLRLQGSGQLDIRHASGVLRDLRRSRNRADYDLDHAIVQSDVMSWVALADGVFRIIQAAGEEPFRSRLAEAIRRFEREVLHEDS